MVETIWDSFAKELLASIPGAGFDVQIGMVHISVNMKLFQDKCVAVTVIVKKIPNLTHAHIQITFISFSTLQQKCRELACSIFSNNSTLRP